MRYELGARRAGIALLSLALLIPAAPAATAASASTAVAPSTRTATADKSSTARPSTIEPSSQAAPAAAALAPTPTPASTPGPSPEPSASPKPGPSAAPNASPSPVASAAPNASPSSAASAALEASPSPDATAAPATTPQAPPVAPEPAPTDPAPPEDPYPTPVPGADPTPIPPPPGAIAPDGVPLGGELPPTSFWPTDLPRPDDPSYQLGPQRAPDCSTTYSVTTADGSNQGGPLKLTLSNAGAHCGIQTDSGSVSRLAYGGGFSVRMVGGTPNLLSNGGLDTIRNGVPTSWYRGGSFTGMSSVTSPAPHSGPRAFSIVRSSTGTSGDLHQSVPVSPNTNYVYGGWTMAAKMTPTSVSSTNPIVSKNVSPVELMAVIKDRYGRTLGTFRAYGYTNDAPWNYQSVGFRTPTNASSVTVSMHIVSGKGTAYFDELSLTQLLATSALGVSSSVSQNGSNLQLSGDVNGQPLHIDATYRGNANHIRIDGAVKLTSGTDDKGFQLTYNLPVNAVGWYWADYARSSRVILSNTRYEFDNHQTTPTSRYPWATVYKSGTSLSMGSPLSVPRGYTTRYDSRQGLTITFDLAVSAAETKLNGSAPFSIVIFTSDSAWGFRAATAKFHAIEPSTFQPVPTPANLLGIPFINPSLAGLDPPNTAVDESKAFGLGMNLIGLGFNGTWGKPNLVWDNKRNIPTFAYTHMWGDFRPKCFPFGSSCAARTYKQFIADVKKDANQTANVRLAQESRAALANAALDINGRYRYDTSASGSEYRIFLNSDPDLASNPDWKKIIDDYMIKAAENIAAATPGVLGGFYVDSTSGFRQWGAVDDYDKKKWAVADSPLIFSYASGRVAQRTYFNNYEQVQRVQAYAHARGQLITLDYNAQELTEGGFLGANLADYFLIENGLPQRAYKDWGVTEDSYALLKRSMAAKRPVGSVDENGCMASFPISSMRFRVQQSLFYDIFPGPCRWQQTSWWDKPMRDLYALYTPFFKRLGLAGWEPVTNARSSNSRVFLERYGRLADADLNLALRNETSSSQSATIIVNLSNQYDTPAKPLGQIKGTLYYQTGPSSRGIYTMKRTTYTLNPSASKTVSVTVTLPAYTTGVLVLTQP